MPTYEVVKQIYMKVDGEFKNAPIGHRFESEKDLESPHYRKLEVASPFPAGQKFAEEVEKGVEPSAEDNTEEQELRAKYKELTGKNAGGRMKIDTLREKIAELEAKEDGE